jgi:hypothetical protein
MVVFRCTKPDTFSPLVASRCAPTILLLPAWLWTTDACTACVPRFHTVCVDVAAVCGLFVLPPSLPVGRAHKCREGGGGGAGTCTLVCRAPTQQRHTRCGVRATRCHAVCGQRFWGAMALLVLAAHWCRPRKARLVCADLMSVERAGEAAAASVSFLSDACAVQRVGARNRNARVCVCDVWPWDIGLCSHPPKQHDDPCCISLRLSSCTCFRCILLRDRKGS